MRQHASFWIATTLLAALAAGCCGGLGGPCLARRQAGGAPIVPSSPPAHAVAPSTEQAAVVRGQDASDAGLWTLPNWEKIKKSPAVNSALKLVGRDLNESLAQQQFKEAEALFEQKEYDQAASLYRKASRHWPDSPLEEDALFMLGECCFFSDKYPAASDAYAELLQKYDNSRHLDKVVVRQFKVAHYWLELQQAHPRHTLNPNVWDRTRPTWDTRGNALKAYETVRLYDPTGPIADDSIFATASNHFNNDEFDDADYYYSLLRSEYPKSEHLMNAYVLGLRAKFRKYGGAQYDGAPLVEAEELIDQMLTLYPDQLGEERQRVIQAGKAVRAQMAERDWEMGEYYHKVKHYRAAGVYYGNVLRDFPETQFAEMARQRLEEIKDLPPEPPQRFKWLSNLFPGESKRMKYAR